ncbi:MAG: hypothetical protein JRJ27_13815 [Deltaproteobacteria bacterium]|nr:hypothetical protein [Deltaproteobacteria bacterium]MBW2364487.1 hypothetical protein [Deltaproteobacteria bacterium]
MKKNIMIVLIVLSFFTLLTSCASTLYVQKGDAVSVEKTEGDHAETYNFPEGLRIGP